MIFELLWSGLLWTSVLVPPLVLLWSINRRRQYGIFRRHGISGPAPEFLWGNWKQLKKDRLQVMSQWIKTYGKVFGMFIAEKPYLVITDIDIIREIFLKGSSQFHDRSEFIINVEPMTSSLILLRGAEWRTVRRVLNFGFTIGKVKSLSGIITEGTNRMLEVLHGYHQRDEAFDSYAVTEEFSLKVISKSALSWEVDSQQDHMASFSLADARKIFEDSGNATIQRALTLPGLKTILKWFIPYTVSGRILRRLADNVRKSISHRRRGESSRVQAESDMLQLMLDAQDVSSRDLSDKSKSAFPLEDRHVIGNSIILLLSAIETTTSVLSFALYSLAAHPEEQEAVYKEMRTLLPSRKEVNFDELQKLKRLDMVVREVLRLFPAIPLMVVRECNQDTNIMGQFIPGGVNLMVPVWHIHRDPHHWYEPSKFLPERFLEQPADRNQATFLPFGLGPRTCLGKRLALFELKAALFKILTSFEVLLSDKNCHPVAVVVPEIILRPESPIMLNLRAREIVK